MLSTGGNLISPLNPTPHTTPDRVRHWITLIPGEFALNQNNFKVELYREQTFQDDPKKYP